MSWVEGRAEGFGLAVFVRPRAGGGADGLATTGVRETADDGRDEGPSEDARGMGAGGDVTLCAAAMTVCVAVAACVVECVIWGLRAGGGGGLEAASMAT